MIFFTKTEQSTINEIPITELDNQIMLGSLSPVCINDGCIVGTEDEA